MGLKAYLVFSLLFLGTPFFGLSHAFDVEPLRASHDKLLQSAFVYTTGAVQFRLNTASAFPPEFANAEKNMIWKLYGLGKSNGVAVQPQTSTDTEAWKTAIQNYCRQVMVDFRPAAETLTVYWRSQQDDLRRDLAKAILGLGLRNVYCVAEVRLTTQDSDGQTVETTPLFFAIDTRPTTPFALGVESMTAVSGPRGSIPYLLNAPDTQFTALPLNLDQGAWTTYPTEKMPVWTLPTGVASLKREYLKHSTQRRSSSDGGFLRDQRATWTVDFSLRENLSDVSRFAPSPSALDFRVQSLTGVPRPGSTADALCKKNVRVTFLSSKRVTLTLTPADEIPIQTRGGCRYLVKLSPIGDSGEIVSLYLDIVPTDSFDRSDFRTLLTELTPVNIPAFQNNPIRTGSIRVMNLESVTQLAEVPVEKRRVIEESYDLYQWVASDKLDSYGRGIRGISVPATSAGVCKGAGGYAKYGTRGFTWCPGGGMSASALLLENMEFNFPYRAMLIDHETRHARLSLRHDREKNYAPCMGTALAAEVGLRIFESPDDVLNFMRLSANTQALGEIFYAYGYNMNEPKLRQGRCQEILDALNYAPARRIAP